jgi:pimeloyl-ACP methyl ester carboxylesterase
MRLSLLRFCLPMLIALSACASEGDDRFPVSSDFPPGLIEHKSVQSPQGWKLATMTSARDAEWRVIVITGTPSWSEYWAPVLAELPETYTMTVVDRPGFAASEPAQVVGSIAEQARALSSLLSDPHPHRKTILVGQSYGAAIAALIASSHPDQVDGLVLVSPFMGTRGPTAQTLMRAAWFAGPWLPRDLRNARLEVKGQGPQLPAALEALANLPQPVVVVHGDKDQFVPITSAMTLVKGQPVEHRAFVSVPGGDHFLNDCCVKALISALDQVRTMSDSSPPLHTGTR